MLWKGQVKCKAIGIRRKETVTALRTGDMQVVTLGCRSLLVPQDIG